MKTDVKMVRNIWGHEIRQRSGNEFFCASDLVNAGNHWRMQNGLKTFNYGQWLKNDSTKIFIEELESRFGQVIIKGNARSSVSWVHPYLFIDLALSISPKLKIEAYSWIYDQLIKYRNQSGDSYKKMCGALYLTNMNKSNFKDLIQNVALKIKDECDVSDWQQASEEQLKLRDKIQENIFLLSDIVKDIDTLINVSVKKAKEHFNP